MFFFNGNVSFNVVKKKSDILNTAHTHTDTRACTPKHTYSLFTQHLSPTTYTRHAKASRENTCFSSRFRGEIKGAARRGRQLLHFDREEGAASDGYCGRGSGLASPLANGSRNAVFVFSAFLFLAFLCALFCWFVLLSFRFCCCCWCLMLIASCLVCLLLRRRLYLLG